MNVKKMIAAALFATLLLPVYSFTQDQSLGKNIEAILQQILGSQKTMQSDLSELKQKIAEQDKEIEALKEKLQLQAETMQAQAQKVEEQVKAIEERPVVTTDGGPTALQVLAAREQYALARDLQHHTIFNVRRGEQREWFERVVKEFRVVVDNYPQAPEAHEAQLRIARTYHRYLDNLAQAKVEYQKLVNDYPQSPYVDEAQKAIANLR